VKIYVIIPVFNEAKVLSNVLQSFINQSCIPDKIIIINDNSTDNSQSIIDTFVSEYSFIHAYLNKSDAIHKPGEKVVNAFYTGLTKTDDSFDLIGKFDADIILPIDYFERMVSIFSSDDSVGIAGGNLFIKEKEEWIFENISSKKKVRGPIKLYRKKCFEEIGGLKKSIGWDTIDELLAQYHGWQIKTDTSLHVKHLRPTGASYTKKAQYAQGEAFYKMRYGVLLSFIAAIKLGSKKKSFGFVLDTMKGFYRAKKNKETFSVSYDEGIFIRNLRWAGIKNKLI
jgi:cellulose synthase/poly-beta-1,6-N-acetylglucosamine synthase-like glycosyltransferase